MAHFGGDAAKPCSRGVSRASRAAMSADPITLESLRMQTLRRHPEWFDIKLHPPLTQRELHQARRQREKRRGSGMWKRKDRLDAQNNV